MKTVVLITIAAILFSCDTNDKKTGAGENQWREEVSAKEGLEHLVFFSLKDSLEESSIQKFKKLLLSLERIEGVVEVEVYKKEEVGDPRALDFDLMMSVEFGKADDLRIYSTHPYHLAVRDSLMGFLAGPPATFDMIRD